MRKTALIIISILFAVNMFAQNATLTGTVTNANGETLAGVTVLTADNQGNITNENGEYELSLPAQTYTITFSYIGYISKVETITLAADEQKALNVVLEETAYLLDVPVITGSRFEQKLGEATVSIDVIKPDLIENSNTIQIDEVLTKVPSLTIVDGQANVRNGSGYSYGAGSRVLLLIDGLPALQGDAGFPNWNFVPVENIGQVEVLKGAASALYGSSAMNGIINIRTAYATSEPFTKVSAFGTTYDTPSDERMEWWSDTTETPRVGGFSIAHRQKVGKLDLVLGAYAVRDQSFRKEAFVNYNRFNANTAYHFTKNVIGGINFNVQKGSSANFLLWENDTTGALIPSGNTITTNENTRIIVDPHLTINKGNSSHKILGRYYRVKNKQGNDLNDQSVFSQMAYGEYQFQHLFTESDLKLTAGLVSSITSVTAALYGDSTYASGNAAIYVQLDKELIENLNVSLGARLEGNVIASPNQSVSERKPVIRAGLNYQLAKATYLRASFGQGYRFPTVAEKYISTSLGALNIYPNDSLSSETGWSAEVGLKQGFKISGFQGYFDAVYYRMQYKDMMEFIFDNYGTGFNDLGFKSLNIGNTSISGVDLSVAGTGNLGSFQTSFLAGYTFSNPVYTNFDEVDVSKNSSTENILKYRFKHNLKFDIYTTYKEFSLGWTTQSFSEMENIDYIFTQSIVVDGVADFRARHQGWTNVSNVRFAYNMTDDLKISFLIKNFFNEEYALRPSLMNAPRNFSFRVDYQIQ
jgi:iron complex outermembrane receptor protein